MLQIIIKIDDLPAYWKLDEDSQKAMNDKNEERKKNQQKIDEKNKNKKNKRGNKKKINKMDVDANDKMDVDANDDMNVDAKDKMNVDGKGLLISADIVINVDKNNVNKKKIPQKGKEKDVILMVNRLQNLLQKKCVLQKLQITLTMEIKILI